MKDCPCHECRRDRSEDAARAEGFDLAVAALRDRERTARYGVDQAIAKHAANHLAAVRTEVLGGGT